MSEFNPDWIIFHYVVFALALVFLTNLVVTIIYSPRVRGFDPTIWALNANKVIKTGIWKRIKGDPANLSLIEMMAETIIRIFYSLSRFFRRS